MSAVLALLAGLMLIAGVSRRWADLVEWHDSQRLLQCALLIGVGASFACVEPLRQGLAHQFLRAGVWPSRLVLATLVAGCLSAIVSGFTPFGLAEVAVFMLSAMLALAVMDARSRAPASFDQVALAVVMAVGTVLVVQFASAYAAALLSDTGFYAENLYRGGFSNPRFLAQFHTMALPLMLAACLHAGFARHWRALFFGVLVLTLVMALLTASRASWYAWAAATLAVLLACPVPGRRMLPLLSVALAGAALAFWLMFYILPPLFIDAWAFDARQASYGRLGEPFGLSLRGELWSRAVAWIGLFPLLGIGPAGLAVDFNPVAAHPHSAPLQVAAEWGLPALAMLTGALTLIAWRIQRGLRQICVGTVVDTLPVVAAALAIAVCGVAIHSLVDGVIVMPQTQVALACVCGWAGACLLPASETRKPGMEDMASAGGGDRRSFDQRRGRGSLCSLAGAAAAGAAMAAVFNAVAPFVAQSDLRMEETERDERASLPTVPRFWSDGWLLERTDLDAVRFLQSTGAGVPPKLADPRLEKLPGK